MSDTEEVSKAIQEVARLGDKGLDTAQKAGSFFAKVFKSPIEELSNIIHDKLRFVRWKRLVEMSDEVNVILDSRGVTETRALPPKLAIPLLEDGSLEDDDELKSLWSKLLANALDPNFTDDIRYGFIEMLKNITGKEVLLLKKLYEALDAQAFLNDISQLSSCHIDKEQITKILQITPEQYLVSAHNLMRLQLIAPAVISGGVSIGSNPLSSYKGTDVIYLTALGVKFVEACIK